MNKQMIYVALQRTPEGTAAHAHVHNIVAGLRKLGWQVTLFEPQGSSRSTGTATHLLRVLALQIRAIPALRRAQVVYVRAHPAATLISLATSVLGVPTVQEINSPATELKDSFPWLKPFLRLLELNTRFMWNRATALVVVTPELGRWLQSHGSRRPYVVIPNGADTEVFHPDAGREDHGLSLPPKYVVFSGEFAAWQGIPTMLEAVNLPEWPDDVCLLLAGDGIQRDLVQRAAAVNDRVRYLGPLPHRLIPALVANSIAALSPKKVSGEQGSVGMSPLKVYEALACGTPVVVTDLPGQREIVQRNSCGMVIPSQDPAALARAVAYLASHEHERELMGARGRSTIEKEHSWETRAAVTSHLLASVARSAPGESNYLPRDPS